MAFLVTVTSLELNAYDFAAPDAEVVAEFQPLAGGSESEEALAEWIREHSGRRAAATLPPPGPKPPAANQQLAHDILKQIVEIRSVHAVGTRGVAEALAARFKAAGFTDAEMHMVPEAQWPNQVNLVVRLKGKGKPVMWICHMDVVDARAEAWTVPPFELTEKDGYFYGRGTSDMKDEDAAVAASLIRLKQEGFVPDRDIIVAFTADEEVGLEQDGPAYLLKHNPDLMNGSLVINPDGGSGEILDGKRLDFGVETVQKTYMTFTMEVTNKGGHSSEPRPDNAIYELANGLVKLSQYQFPYRTNATTRADATIQCRVWPGDSVEQVRTQLQQVVNNPDIRTTLTEPVVQGPETVPDPEVMAAITDVVHSMWPGVTVLPQMVAGASDSLFTRSAGLPSYGVGGGWNDLQDIRMHGRDERHEINDSYSTVEFTYRLMKKLGMAAGM